MKILRLLSLLLLASPLAVRAFPTVSLTETWKEMFVTNPVTHVTSIVTNGSASFTFSGAKLTNAGPIGFQTFFFFGGPGTPIGTPLAGSPFDSVNPSVSSWTPGATSATITFYHNTPDTNGNPHYAVTKTLKISWANNILSGSFTGPSGALGSERSATQTPPIPSPLFFPVALGFGNSFQTVNCVQFTTNKVSSGFPFNSGSATLMSDYTPPTVTITSPAPNISTNNPLIEVTGTFSDNAAVFLPLWRLAAPTDNPSLGEGAFMWNVSVASGVGVAKSTTWTAPVVLSPGTNWFWASGTDLAHNAATIVTREFFYSTRSPLTLSASGNGTVTGGKGVTNGAMLEVGRGYTVSAKANDTNTVFLDWRTGDGTPTATVNPWNFLMQSNMTIVGNFIPNPFPAIVGTYSGLFYDPTSPISTGNAGYITITVKRDGTYSGTALFGAQRLPITGKLFEDLINTNQFMSLFALGRERSPLGRLVFPTDGSGNLLPSPTIAMTISNHTFLPLPLTLASNVVSAGLYNMSDSTLLPNPPTNSIGNSYASITVTSKGQANVTVHMADGSAPAATFSGPVGMDGSVAFFIPLYAGNGLVMGNVNLTGGVVANSRGNQDFWMKSPNPKARYFPDGFNNAMNWGGSAYTPTFGTNFFANLGILQIQIWTRTNGFATDVLFVQANNTFTNSPTSFGGDVFNLKFNPATGLITGSFSIAGRSFASNVAVPIGWANGTAYGYALSPNDSVGIIIKQDNLFSLGQYDVGFVLEDINGGFENGQAATAFFAYANSDQGYPSFPNPTQLIMRKSIQVAPHQQLLITDTYQSMFYVDSAHFAPLPNPPYTGTDTPPSSGYPAVSAAPIQRTGQYFSN